MTELQRSVTSFRRQGSSGLVWDDKFIAGLQNQETKPNQNEQGSDEVRGQRQMHTVGSSATLERSRSTGARPYRTVNVVSPSIDPPSPKLPTCAFCALFQKPRPANPKSKRHIVIILFARLGVWSFGADEVKQE
ncbi:MAPK kinase substrate protein, partial [Mucuna pruriens]